MDLRLKRRLSATLTLLELTRSDVMVLFLLCASRFTFRLFVHVKIPGFRTSKGGGEKNRPGLSGEVSTIERATWP